MIKRNSPLGTSAAVLEEKPHCILLDVNMTALPGDKMVALLKKNKYLESKIFLYSDMCETKLTRLAAETGADGYLNKSGDKNHMVEKVRPLIPSQMTTSPLFNKSLPLPYLKKSDRFQSKINNKFCQLMQK